jgi:hypothetical protein
MDCPDCHVLPGAWHRPGCVFEQCPYCGKHTGDCGCCAGLPPLDDRLRWTGCCTYVEACLRFGFFERQDRGRWVPCRAEEDGAEPDVFRLLLECRWHRGRKWYELRQRKKAV